MVDINNIGSEFEDRSRGVTNDTGLPLSDGSLQALEIQKFYMPDYSEVKPLSDSEASLIAFGDQYDGWQVDVGEDGTVSDLPMPGQLQQIAQPEAGEKPGVMETVAAAFKMENEVFSYASSEVAGEYFAPVADYDALQDERLTDPRYEPYVKDLIFARSPNELDANIRQIDNEMANREIIAARPVLGGLSMIGSQAFSPLFYMSLLVPVSGALRGGKVLTTAAEFMVAGVAMEGIAEISKMDTQITRTKEEAALNVAAAGLLSGVIGGGVAAFTKGKMAKMTAQTADDLSNNKPLTKQKDFGDANKMTDAELEADIMTPGKMWNDSLSAAKVRVPVTLEDYALEFALGFEKLGMNPITRLAKSSSLSARKMTSWLVNNPYYLKGQGEAGGFKNLSSSVGSAEANIDMMVTNLNAESLISLQDNFAKYRGVGEKSTWIGEMKTNVADLSGQSSKQGKMTWDEFKVAVSKEMRGTAVSSSPEVVAAAKTLRDKVYTPMLEKLKHFDLVGKEIDEDYAGKYLYRLWDAQTVAARRPELKKIFTEYFKRKQDELKQTIKYWEKDTAAAPSNQLAQDYRMQIDDLERGIDDEVGSIKGLLRADFDPNNPQHVRQTLNAGIKKGSPGYLDKPPSSLASSVRARGGLIDSGGELAARGITNKSYPGLITTDPEKGLRVDDIAEWAFDEGFTYGVPPSMRDGQGYYSGGYEELDFNQILDDLAAEVTGNKSGRVKKWPFDVESEIDNARMMADSEEFGMAVQAGLGRRSNAADIREYILKGRGDSVEAFDARLKDLKKREVTAASEYAAAVKARQEMAEFLALDEGGLAYEADMAIDNILGNPANKIDSNVLSDSQVIKASPLKSRMIDDIDERFIEEFLNNDIEQLTKAYTQSVVPQLQLKSMFDDVGLKDVLDSVKNEWGDARELAVAEMKAAGKTEKEIEKYLVKANSQEAGDINDIKALRDKLLGIYNKPADPDGFWIRASQFVKRLNLLTHLGGMQLAAIPDLARPIMTKGLRPSMRALKSVNSTAWKLSEVELRKAGIVYESLLNSRLRTWSDITEDLSKRGAVEKGADSLAMGFGKVTGMSFHNDFMKSFSGAIMQDEILRTARKIMTGGKLTTKELRDAAKSGLGRDQLDDIVAEMRKGHFDDNGEILVPLTDNWNAQTAQAMRSAVRKSVDEMIVTVGKGEMPLWMSKELGSHVMQFKSFLVSSHSRVLMSGLQQKDMAALEGLIIAVGMGYTVNVIKDRLGNNPGRFGDKDFSQQMVDSVDRAGVLGWIMEPYGIANKMSGGQISIGRLWGAEPDQLSRYAQRNIIGSIAGVTTDTLGNLAAATSSISSGNVSEGDVNAVRKMIPYQNLWYMDWLFDHVSEGAKEKFVTN